MIEFAQNISPGVNVKETKWNINEIDNASELKSAEERRCAVSSSTALS